MKSMYSFIFFCLTAVCVFIFYPNSAHAAADSGPIVWGSPVLINNVPNYTDAGPDARGIAPGKFGSQFPRMTKMSNGDWLIVYTIYDNNGYTYDVNGGNKLQISKSTNNGRSWTTISTLADPGRDLDNGHIIQLGNGDLLMAARSVRWQESYKLPVYKSTNGGVSWTLLSIIDQNNGTPGSLGNPDKGVYEPYFYALDNGRIGVMYANEKHVTENPSYAQTISMKVSSDSGATWGNEIFVVKDTANSASRPGMPVWTKMNDGRYMVVYETCGTYNCNAFYKISNDGTTWPSGIGTLIPYQTGAPFVLSLADGRLVVTSNTHEISISRDYGTNWYLNDTNAWGSLASNDNLWPALYQTGPNEVAAVTSAGRSAPGLHNEGHNIQVKFGTFSSVNVGIVSGAYYKVVAQHSGKNLDVDAGSGLDGANVQQWSNNDLPPQIWQFLLQSDGSYKIKNMQSGKLLEVNANSSADGANVQQWGDNGCSCQRWFVEYVGGGIYRFKNASSGKNLDVSAGSISDGANVHQWSENGARPQRWKLVPVEGGITSGSVYRLINKQSSKALETAAGSLSAGANVQQWTYGGQSWQKWKITYVSNGYYKLTNNNSNLALDVSGGSLAAGANVQQWTDTGADPQLWKIEYMGNGYFKLTAKHSGHSLDVSDGSMLDGGNVQQWTDNGLDPQRWQILS